MSIPILFRPLELFFVDDIDLAKGKEAGSNGNQALCSSPADICLFPSLHYNVTAHRRRNSRPVKRLVRWLLYAAVIPANAGIQSFRPVTWIPASAGMTRGRTGCPG